MNNFSCDICKTDYTKNRNPCCPNLFNKIINYPPHVDYNKERGTVEKYRPLINGKPSEHITTQYTTSLKKIGLKGGCVLDYGCSHGHASTAIKEYSPNLTYIGADIEIEVIIPGVGLYPQADFFYLVSLDEDKCFKNLSDKSMDIIFVSRLTQWNNCESFWGEFNRLLKPGGWILFYGNRGFPGYKERLYTFHQLCNNFNVSKAEASRAAWGHPDAYLKKESEITEVENNSAIRILARKS